MVLAANDVEIHENTIEGSTSVAVLALSYQTAELAGAPMARDPMYEPHLEQLWVYGNTTARNSTMPAPLLVALGGPGPFPDMLWDGRVRPGMEPNSVCVAMTTMRDADVENTPPVRSEDVSMHTCTRTSRAPVVIASR